MAGLGPSLAVYYTRGAATAVGECAGRASGADQCSPLQQGGRHGKWGPRFLRIGPAMAGIRRERVPLFGACDGKQEGVRWVSYGSLEDGGRAGRQGGYGTLGRDGDGGKKHKEKQRLGVGISSSDIVGAAAAADVEPGAGKGLFPGGLRRAEVQIPGLVLRVKAEEVAEGDGSEALALVSTGVANGVTMVVLEAGTEGGAGGARLYEAARSLKAALRGRAMLLVAERVDIAAAAGADGVLLSDQGLPAVVARRMMQSSLPETIVSAPLPVVARWVGSAASAVSATADEGADLLILQPAAPAAESQDLVRAVGDRVSIPVFLDASEGLEYLLAGGNGLVLDLADARESGKGDVGGYIAGLQRDVASAIQQRILCSSDEFECEVYGSGDEEERRPGGRVAPLQDSLDRLAEEIVEEERELLTAMIDFVRDAAPEMEEVSLLVDALAQLDELFLLVVVGEFNSGKSSVINALLGKKFLREGVLPTTNEITLLRHCGDSEEATERSERHPDGHFMQFLPAPLLKQMNLVDTPGTNVILQRQQRLTEEFVPRADLVLFVLSADRPFTESEVSFLRYIRQWGKKVIFILNKSDVFKVPQELEEVKKFVADNAQSFLNIERAFVYPVSARRAIKAKLAASNDGVIDEAVLFEDDDWKISGFDDLESFILGFMGGSTDAGAERIRLKLDTPLGIGLALLAACERQLTAEKTKAEADLQTLNRVEEQVQRYEEALQSTAILQRQRTTSLVQAAKDRADRFVEDVLRLSNVEVVAKYVVGSDRTQSLPVAAEFERKVLDSAYAEAKVSLEEHAAWLEANNERQLKSYIQVMRSRWPDLHPAADATGAQELVESADKTAVLEPNKSMGVLKEFDTKAALILLEQEMREVVMGTVGGLGAAGLSASVLTTILPTTLEDLIALGLCSAGGLVGVLNLPFRRADVKKKVTQVADSLGRQLDAAMQTDLQEAVSRVREEVGQVLSPYRNAAQLESERVTALQARLQELDNRLRLVRNRVQNLGA